MNLTLDNIDLTVDLRSVRAFYDDPKNKELFIKWRTQGGRHEEKQ